MAQTTELVYSSSDPTVVMNLLLIIIACYLWLWNFYLAIVANSH